MGKARESGILDFHRVSPMAPAAVVLGFFFGAPIREYLLFAATLPFSMICVYKGPAEPLRGVPVADPAGPLGLGLAGRGVVQRPGVEVAEVWAPGG